MKRNKQHIKHLISILIILIYTFSSHHVFSQIIDNNSPASWVKFRSIESENFQLIFPEEFEKPASLLAQKIDQMIQHASEDLGKKPRKISIILHSNHVEQNGFAQLAPRKIEAFSVPGPESDNTTWLDNLLQHELRHVAQFDKLTGKIKGPFFEQLAFALYGINLPAWYFEGDAVSIETQFSSGGRGRSSSWMTPLKANLLSEKNYDFNKNIHGSFRDLTPNYYLTGYAINSYISNHFGYKAKEMILEDMRKNLLRPFNFQRALKRTTGMKSPELFQKTTEELKQKWGAINTQNYAEKIPVKNEKYWEQQWLPQSDITGQIYYLKEAPNSRPRIMKYDGEKSTLITELGYQLRPYFHVNNQRIVWDELRRDARFGKQTYSIIRIKNLKSGQVKSISHNSRFYSPVLTRNAQKVFCLQVEADNRFNLIYIDPKTTKITKIAEFPSGFQIQQPALNPQETKIIAIAISPKGTNLIEIDLNSGEFKSLFPWSNIEYQRPIYGENSIYFRANFNQQDEIYSYQNESQQLYQLSHSAFGSTDPSLSLDSQRLLFSNYTPEGYRITELATDTLTRTAVQPSFQAISSFDMRLLDESPNLISSDSSQQFTSKPYQPISDLFHFHSLTLSSNNFANFDNYRPGIFWQANDLLNTSELRVGYEYDLDLEKSIFSAELNYHRYYPSFTLRYQNLGQLGYAQLKDQPDTAMRFDFREHRYELFMELPFLLYRGPYNLDFGLQIGTAYQKRYALSLQKLEGFYDEIAFPLNYQLYFGRTKLRSSMDLIPRWGQQLSVIYRHTPFQHGPKGNSIALRSNFYFPGLFENHGLRARFSWQQSDGRYLHTQDIPMVSGYAHMKNPAIVHNTLLLNYHFPIAYPDWSLGHTGYIKRFHGYLFADYQNIQDSKFAPTSYGLGLTMDFNLFGYVLPDFSAGIKCSYLNEVSTGKQFIPSFSLGYSY